MGVYIRPIWMWPQGALRPMKDWRVKASEGPGMVPMPVSGVTPASSMKRARQPPPSSSTPRKPMREAALPPSSRRVSRVPPDRALLRWTSMTPKISTLLCAQAALPNIAQPVATSHCLCFTMCLLCLCFARAHSLALRCDCYYPNQCGWHSVNPLTIGGTQARD